MNEMLSITERPARELADMIARRELRCSEVMEAFLTRIAQINGAVNAICTLDEEGALDAARRADEGLESGDAPGRLCGLPIAIKDLAETRGMRTTQGSPLLADWVPGYDQLFVERIRAAGAIVIGKTNTPEFGAGSQTFNPVFGATRNPWDLSKTPGGSSGGAAAALAARMLPIADGSDFGGSLRNPASFCNVVGFRVSPGLVPTHPSRQLFEEFSILGPMARDTKDAALLLSVMAGPDPRAPLSMGREVPDFARDLHADVAGSRIGWSPDLGFLPVESEVREVLGGAVREFEGLGCTVEEAAPDLGGAEEVFLTLRSVRFAGGFAAVYRSRPESLKDTIRWNIEQGLGTRPEEIAAAEAKRSQLYLSLLQFFETYDYLALPAVQVLPFPVEQEWVREIEGCPMDNYLQWMQACCVISLFPVPALSVPGGFSREGLPIGLQLVGRPAGDLELLQLAHAFEQATRYFERVPRGIASLEPARTRS